MHRRRAVIALASGFGVSIGGYELFRQARERRSYRSDDDSDSTAPDLAGDLRRPEAPTRDGQLLHGFTPDISRSGTEGDRDRLTVIDQWTDAPPATITVYVDMGWPEGWIEEFVYQGLTAIWNHGHVPQLIFQPLVRPADETSEDIPQEISNGEHDEILSFWADTLSEWIHPEIDGSPERRLYLNFAPEMNGDWIPWGAATGDTSPDDYVEMWNRLYDIVMGEDIGSEHIQWIWAPNIVGRDTNPISDYYPGDDEVNWVGVHGYNRYEWGGWQEPDQIYDNMIDSIRSITDLPLAVTEYGCSSTYDGENRPARKDEWIGEVFEYFEQRDVRMANWFNLETETDWAVFNSEHGLDTWSNQGSIYDVYPAYQQAVQSDSVLPAHPRHTRRLTDKEFAGEF